MRHFEVLALAIVFRANVIKYGHAAIRVRASRFVSILPVSAPEAEPPSIGIDVPAGWSDGRSRKKEPLVAGRAAAAVNFSPAVYRSDGILRGAPRILRAGWTNQKNRQSAS